MKVPVKCITIDNPATYLFNKYRTAAANHINCALRTIVANAGNYPAVMATVDQLYEDLQNLKLIGILSDRDYDAAAAIAFDVLSGDHESGLNLPDIAHVYDMHGDVLFTMQECQRTVRLAIATPVNKCLAFLTDKTEEWKNDGWETVEEYHKFVRKTIHNIMRIGKIIGATTESDHDIVSEAIKASAESDTPCTISLE